MIGPYPARRITCIAARASRMLPSRLTASTSSNTSAGCRWNIPATPIPALATQNALTLVVPWCLYSKARTAIRNVAYWHEVDLPGFGQ
jgi:hypothetical protein